VSYDFRERIGRLIGRSGEPQPSATPQSRVFPVISLNLHWATPGEGSSIAVGGKEESNVVVTGEERVGLYVRMGEAVGSAIAEHEAQYHIPPPRRGPLKAIPFPDVSLTDIQTVRARELLESGVNLYETAEIIGVPASVIERELAAFEPRWQRYLRDLRTGV
jgi:hypothetical protein